MSLCGSNIFHQGRGVARYSSVWQDCVDRNNISLAVPRCSFSSSTSDTVKAPDPCAGVEIALVHNLTVLSDS